MNDNKHAAICGGVTEYLIKIKLNRRLGRSLDELGFSNEKFKERYGHYDDEDIAFLLYRKDIVVRSGGSDFSKEALDEKDLIIAKSIELLNIALSLIDETFPVINEIDFHPKGHIKFDGRILIKGDSDLLINNCLIDFKLKKEPTLTHNERAQLFAYAINKYIRGSKNYDKVYYLNPRFYLLQELNLNNQ